ncbi:MAG: excinuclease ABC subunit C [Sphingobacteriales bacterium]|nr:MAG: excinuclease ABC subunit C [Sphingobacteriales bacterium]
MQNLREEIRNLPDNPGVYKYFDAEDRILYIGKARNLKKRVSSYFVAKADQSYRIRVMVSKIRRIEYTIVATEYDALLLENNLIKKHQPRYNVSLKDGKTYPFIVIKNERFPRIYPTRNPIKDGSEYFGPYANVGAMHNVVDLIRKLFPTRSCHFALTEENINAHKFRVCLDYHIHLCKGPCEGLQNEADYNNNIEHIRHILKGNMREPVQYINTSLQSAVENLQFEEAQFYKEKLDLLEKFQAKSTVVSSTIHNVDVFSIYSNDGYAFVNYLRVANGTIVTTDTIEFKKKMQEDDSEVLLLAMAELREKYNSTSKEIILPFPLLLKIDGINFHVPKAGDKKKLLELSRRNAFIYFQNRIKSTELNKDKRKNTELLTAVKNDLGLKEIPYHIECFDNSNLQGTNPISAIVVFKNGVPSKKDYRYFNVRTVEGPDDFSTMEEAVFRRYRRLIEEKQELPQLIIIDGGKGQLSSAMKSLDELKISDKVEIVSIAKRLEEIYKPGDPLPLSINKKSQSLRLIQRARDEAHRFGITKHRKKRIATNLVSTLEDIPGIGKKTAEKLLSYFKSVKKMQDATPEEIESVVGKARAKTVLEKMGKR